MRRGIFGGTFDPVHLGHLILAECCREQAKLDEIRFLPCWCSPFKQDRPLTEARLRADMLDFSTAGFRDYVVDRREIKRKKVSYTVETLETIHEEFLDDELVFLMGADSLLEFHKWKQPERILELAELAVVLRAGNSTDQLNAAIDALGTSADDRIQLIEMPTIEISSSEIRQRVSAGQSIRFLTHKPVVNVIDQHQLYRHSGGTTELRAESSN